MATLKRNEQLNSLFNQFMRAIKYGNLDLDTAFYVVIGDNTGKDTEVEQLDYIMDIFFCSYREVLEIQKELGISVY